jgi:hypothetical protein
MPILTEQALDESVAKPALKPSSCHASEAR